MPLRGSVSGDLGRLARRLPGYFNLEARRASRIMRDEIRDRTPVGRKIDPRNGRFMGTSGQLRRSINTIPPRKVDRDRWVAGAESNLDYASHVEYGTRAHVIQGNLYLRFWSAGQLIIRRRVNHPGAEGHFMFIRGAQAAEGIFQRDANRNLQVFLETF